VADTTADILIDRLIHWGVQEVFGLPGDGINGIMESLRKRQDKIRAASEHDLDTAARILNQGKRTVILVGQGALDARSEVIALAERLNAPIVKALLGKAVVPDDCPYTTGGIGLLGTRASQESLEDCDTLLIAGSSFPYIEFYAKPGQARAIQIDIDPVRIGGRRQICGAVNANARGADVLPSPCAQVVCCTAPDICIWNC
jgi:thiamine pyrophosphate-dependent acetolactate synthase large subunit-like protein